MKKKIFKISLLAIFMGFMSCSKDDAMPNENASQNTKVSITDAPIDNANVSAAVVTIADVQIDGVSIEGFSKTTLDLMQYQNGKKLILGNLDLSAGAVSNVDLILDYDQDQNGNAPGCYIATTDGAKHELRSASSQIRINDSAEIVNEASNELIIDFDLRKTVIEDDTNSNDQYDFVSATELSKGLRLVNKLQAGSVSGTASDTDNTSDKIIVYAYKKGTFNSNELEGQGNSNVRFANAVSSSVVNASTGAYQINFLKEGDYEFHFASYTQSSSEGEFEFSGMLKVDSLTEIQSSLLKVSSNTNITLNVIITGKF